MRLFPFAQLVTCWIISACHLRWHSFILMYCMKHWNCHLASWKPGKSAAPTKCDRATDLPTRYINPPPGQVCSACQKRCMFGLHESALNTCKVDAFPVSFSPSAIQRCRGGNDGGRNSQQLFDGTSVCLPPERNAAAGLSAFIALLSVMAPMANSWWSCIWISVSTLQFWIILSVATENVSSSVVDATGQNLASLSSSPKATRKSAPSSFPVWSASFFFWTFNSW